MITTKIIVRDGDSILQIQTTSKFETALMMYACTELMSDYPEEVHHNEIEVNVSYKDISIQFDVLRKYEEIRDSDPKRENI